MKILLHNAAQGHTALRILWADTIKPMLMAGHRIEVDVAHETRSKEQNAAQWPILQAFAAQLLWPVNGQMTRMTADEWKDVLTAAFRQEQPRLAMGLNGGVVMLGQRTSKFRRSEWGAWMEFLNAVAADRGVRIPAPKSMESA